VWISTILVSDTFIRFVVFKVISGDDVDMCLYIICIFIILIVFVCAHSIYILLFTHSLLFHLKLPNIYAFLYVRIIFYLRLRVSKITYIYIYIYDIYEHE
jgi:hypothetical protein